MYLDSSTVSRSITGASGGKTSRAWRPRRGRRRPASATIHRRYHGEPHGQPERGLKAGSASPTPRAWAAAVQGQVLVTIPGGQASSLIASGAPRAAHGESAAAPGERGRVSGVSSTQSRSITGASGGNSESLGRPDGGGARPASATPPTPPR
ncbi:MAG: hypothetical protein IPN05_19900 [Sulfuritalea sp.]|nr:hypothetical protein [Sulfuritalea sp.]